MKTTIEIPIAKWLFPHPEGSTYKVVVNREDRDRILARTWNAIHDSQGNITPYTNVGSESDPIYLPLANYLLGVDNSVFVEHLNRSGADFRKANLTVKR